MDKHNFQRLKEIVDEYLGGFYYSLYKGSLSNFITALPKSKGFSHLQNVFDPLNNKIEDWKLILNHYNSIHLSEKLKPEFFKVKTKSHEGEILKQVLSSCSFLWLNFGNLDPEIYQQDLTETYVKSQELTAAPIILTYNAANPCPDRLLDAIKENSRDYYIINLEERIENNFYFGLTSRKCFDMYVTFLPPLKQEGKIFMKFNSKKATLLEMGIMMRYLKNANPVFVSHN